MSVYYLDLCLIYVMFISFFRNIYLPVFNKSILLSRYKPQASCATLINTSAVESYQKGDSEINITESCVERLKKIASDEVFLRIAIDGGGCSGFQYRLDLDSTLQDDDVCFNRDGAKVVVDKVSLDFLRGATVDYKEELIRSSFTVTNNPQADTKCSCGISFAVKMS